MASHRVVMDWMGTDVETLADLLPPSPLAVCVGINPAPVSVAAGHYFQGRQGQRFFARLRQAGVLGESRFEFDDDQAVEEGIGFTDVVKRPTARANEVSSDEMRYGVERLSRTLSTVRAPVLILPFKAAATTLVGPFSGNGWLHPRFAEASLFVMPGPYESLSSATATIASLGERLGVEVLKARGHPSDP